MATLTVDDYELAFLIQTLGGLAVATDSIQDLRYKFYKGVVEGSISLGGGSTAPALEAGEYVRPAGQYTNGSISLNPNKVLAIPIFLPAGTYQSIHTIIGTAGPAGALLRLAVMDGRNVLKDYGTQAGDTTGVKQVVSNLVIATAKWYWVAAVHQGVTTTAIQLVRVDHPASSGVDPFSSSDMQFSPGGCMEYQTAQAGALAGALPGVRSSMNHGPGISLRLA